MNFKNIYFLLTLAVLFWSGNFVVARFVNEEIHPMTLSLLRWFGVLMILLPYIYLNRFKILQIIKDNFLSMWLFSLLGVTGFNTFVYYGLQSTTATNALLINSSTPILIILINQFFGSKITKPQLLGVVLSTIGVIFLIIKGDIQNIIDLEFNSGDFWILLSSLDWALYSVFLKYKSENIKPFEFLSVITILGFIALVFSYYLLGFSFALESFNFSETIYLTVIYIAIFSSILSFYFYNRAILEIGANKTGQFAHLMPIFGAILAYFFLNEKIFLYHLVGVVLIAVGIYLSSFYKKD